MKKAIVIYYSNKGSNRFLANKIADNLKCDIEELKPRLNVQMLMMMGIGFGNKKLKADLSKYDLIILCGPIWVGKLIIPLKAFIKKYNETITKLVFVTCCGSRFEDKDKKFGHGLVFNVVNEMVGEKCSQCEAFPITLVVPEDKIEDANEVLNTRLTEANFKGEIRERFDKFMDKLKVMVY